MLCRVSQNSLSALRILKIQFAYCSVFYHLKEEEIITLSEGICKLIIYFYFIFLTFLKKIGNFVPKNNFF